MKQQDKEKTVNMTSVVDENKKKIKKIDPFSSTMLGRTSSSLSEPF